MDHSWLMRLGMKPFANYIKKGHHPDIYSQDVHSHGGSWLAQFSANARDPTLTWDLRKQDKNVLHSSAFTCFGMLYVAMTMFGKPCYFHRQDIAFPKECLPKKTAKHAANLSFGQNQSSQFPHVSLQKSNPKLTMMLVLLFQAEHQKQDERKTRGSPFEG